MEPIKVRANYYQQFDADHTLPVPGQAYGGWKQADIEISPEHTAVVVMHAWNCGTPEQYPGWHRAVEYMTRAAGIYRTVFPPLLSAVRRSPLKLFHVVGYGKYYQDLSAYKRTVDLAGPEAPREWIQADPALRLLQQFRKQNVFVGPHNEEDVRRGSDHIDFPDEARPVGDEPIAETANQLFAVCKETGVNHLIYAGFAINWCLVMSPGGMLDMSRHGTMCSAIRQAVTAVENKESAQMELHKEEALWRVALAWGFVFDVDDLIAAIGPRNGA